MGDRYYLTGVQLGMLKGLMEAMELNTNIVQQIKEILEEIEEKQFIGTKEDLEKALKEGDSPLSTPKKKKG